MLHVNLRGRDEGVDARARGVFDALPGRVDVQFVGARQAGDHGPTYAASDLLDGFEVAGRRDRKARLDDVHAERGELLGQFELFAGIHRKAG